MPSAQPIPRRPPAFIRIRRRAIAAIVVCFLLAFAAVVSHHGGGTPAAIAFIVFFMVAIRSTPAAIGMFEDRIRREVSAQIQSGELPCSVCETSIRIGADADCPGCGSTLSLAVHRARWGV